MARTRAQKDGKKCKYSSIRYPLVEDAILTVAATLNLKVSSTEKSAEIANLKDKLAELDVRYADIKQRIKNTAFHLSELRDSSGLLDVLSELEASRVRSELEQISIQKSIDELELAPKALNVWKELSNMLRTLRGDAADRSKVELRTKINNQLVQCLDRIDFDLPSKVATIHIDDSRSVDLLFNYKSEKGYTIKPSWERGEFLPSTFVVRQTAMNNSKS